MRMFSGLKGDKWKAEEGVGAVPGRDAKLSDADSKLGWLAALGTAVGTVFTALHQFKIFEPAGLGRFCFGAAGLCIALAVAVLARGWLRPQTAPKAVESKALAGKYGAVFGFLALLLAGVTPLVSLAYPEVGAGWLGRRMVLGYGVVPGHPDSLVMSASGRVDPSASVVVGLSLAESVGNAGAAGEGVPLRCEERLVARWGIVPSSEGNVVFEGRTTVPRDAVRALCVRAWAYERGIGRELAGLVIPAVVVLSPSGAPAGP